MSDSDLRQALLGTWRLISLKDEVAGTVVKPFGGNPLGYLVYAPDDHVFVQFATRAPRNWPGSRVLELPPPQQRNALGFIAYCGTFQAHDGQVVHHQEFGVLPWMSGSVQPRALALDGDRLILGARLRTV
jgi:hypothetical protein